MAIPNVVSTLVSVYPCEPKRAYIYADPVGTPTGGRVGNPGAPNGPGTQYLAADFSIVCNSLDHNALTFIAGPGLAVYALGVPTLLAILLLKNRKSLLTYGTYDKLGFLYGCYHDHAFWFDVWQLCRKIFAVTVGQVIWRGGMMQVLMILAFFTFSLIVQVTFKPFRPQYICTNFAQLLALPSEGEMPSHCEDTVHCRQEHMQYLECIK